MPFDGSHFDPEPPPPPRNPAAETLLWILLVGLAVCGLVLPISAAGLQDLAAYLWPPHPHH